MSKSNHVVARHRRRPSACALIALVTVCAAPTASAAPPSLVADGITAYGAQEFERARAILEPLAKLGQPDAQALVGQMVRHGQGGPASEGAGLGWMKVAGENGFAQFASQSAQLDAAIRSLPAADQQAAEAIRQGYGRETLARTLLPEPSDTGACAGTLPAKPIEKVLPDYPKSALAKGRNANVLLSARVGTDGLAYEPEVVATFPAGDEFAQYSVRALLRGLQRPSSHEGTPQPGGVAFSYRYRIDRSTPIWAGDEVKELLRQAKDGDPTAQYQVGAAAAQDEFASRIPFAKALRLVTIAAQAGLPDAQYWLATAMMRVSGCPGVEKGKRWLEAATAAHEPRAMLESARRLLAGHPDVEQRDLARDLLVQTLHGSSVFAARLAGAILATSPDERVRDAKQAYAVLSNLNTSAYEYDPLTWEARAAAAAGVGRFRDATADQQHAVDLAQFFRWDLERLVARLTSYRHDKAWMGELLEHVSVAPPGPRPTDLQLCMHTKYQAPCIETDL